MLHVTSLDQVLTSAVVSGNNCVSVVEMIQAQSSRCLLETNTRGFLSGGKVSFGNKRWFTAWPIKITCRTSHPGGLVIAVISLFVTSTNCQPEAFDLCKISDPNTHS